MKVYRFAKIKYRDVMRGLEYTEKRFQNIVPGRSDGTIQLASLH